MNIKLGCALAILSFLSFEYVNGGALKKDFSKDNKQKEEKNEEHVDASSDEKDEEESSSENQAASEEKSDESSPAEAVSSQATSQGEVSAPAASEKRKIVGDPVVLKIGRKEFKRSQILDDMKLIPPQLIKGIAPDKLFGMLIDQKMSTYLMVEQAKKAGMDKTKEFIDRIERMKDELLARTFLMKEVAPKAENESVLKARYTKYLVEFKKGKEHHLYHIMLASEAEAKKVLESLAKGEDFAKLAKEKSMAPSKEKDGDEGFIPLNILPSPIKEKLTALKSGEYTKEFIKTEGGFHIFKVAESRDTAPQKYEEVKDMLKQMIVQEEIMKMIGRLEKQYNVEKFHEDGTPMPPRSAVPADSQAAVPAV